MSVHYKFKSGKEAHTITFDSLHISVGELKKCIMQQRKIGKSAELDLQITNAQTKEVYESDSILIPKNTSVIVARVPVAPTKKSWNKNDKSNDNTSFSTDENPKLTKSNNLAEGTEEDKIKEMLTQSTKDYDPSKYARGKGPLGPLPPNYTCYRCGKPGHYIKHCPTNNVDVKRSTGIPRSFMIPAKADQKGAMITAIGEYAVPIIDHDAYREVKKEKPPFFPTEVEPEVPKVEIPDDLKCSLCNNLLQDAVLIPCCGNSFCDECIRSLLLDSDNHECPSCKETGVSPDTLIPNRFLRLSVTKFKNETTLAVTRPAVDENKVVEASDVKTEEPPQTNEQKENDTSNDRKMDTDSDKDLDKDKETEKEIKEEKDNDTENDEDTVKVKDEDEDEDEDEDSDKDDKSDESRNNEDHDMESENENENNKNENNKNESENEKEKVKDEDEDDNTNDSKPSEPIKLYRPTNNPIRVRSSNQPSPYIRLQPGPMLHRNNFNQNRTLLPNEAAFFNYPMQPFAQVGMPMQYGMNGGFGPQMRNQMFDMFNNRGGPMNSLLPFGGNLNMAALGGHGPPMMDADGHFFPQYKYDNLDEIDEFNRHLESRSRQRRYSRERSHSRSGRSNSRSRNDHFRRSRSPMRSRRSMERKRSPVPAYGKDKRDRRVRERSKEKSRSRPSRERDHRESKDRDRSRRSAEKNRERDRERERVKERDHERSRRDHSREKKSEKKSRRREKEVNPNGDRSSRKSAKGPKVEKGEQSSKKKKIDSRAVLPSTVHSANTDGDAHGKGN